MNTWEETKLLHKLDTFTALNETADAEQPALDARLAALADELLETRRRRVDELLEKERLADRLAKLVDVMPGALLVLDPSDVILECNPAALALLGRPLIGCTWTEILERATPCPGHRKRFRLADGRFISVEQTNLDHEDGTLLLITDITEAEQLASLVEQQNRLAAMGEMSARLAHQVRTPLAAALLYLTQLKKRDTGSREDARYVEQSLRRLRDLEALINDMLIFAGGQRDQHRSFDLADALEDALETIGPQLDDPFQIRMEGETGGLPISGNQRALQSAIVNLLENAIEANDAHDAVTVSLSNTPTHAILRIRDQGPGVPDEFADRIFEPFFSTRSTGTGLGLAVVHSVVQAHGGNVEVDDVGDGAEFVVELPLRQPIAVGFQGSAIPQAGAYVG